MTIGLTGGIGSGKSVVARLFEVLGCAVFNSDQVARQLYYEADIAPQVVDLLGAKAYRSPAEIDKTYISSLIFKNEQLRQQLNAILHPAVGRRFAAFVQANPHRTVVKETALLFEQHLERQVDKTIVVRADDDLRINRVMHRDGLSRSEVLNKLHSQMPQEEKAARADFVIDNSERDLLIPQVVVIYNRLHGA